DSRRQRECWPRRGFPDRAQLPADTFNAHCGRFPLIVHPGRGMRRRHRTASIQYHGAGRLDAPSAAMTGARRQRGLHMIHTREESDIMSEQVQATAAVDVPVEQSAGDTPAAPRPQPQAISDPRQIAAVVMARMNLINTKKDELTIAMKGLTDLTQQLVQAYAAQMQVIEQLAARLKAVEEKAGGSGVNGQAMAPAMPSA